MSFYQKYRPQKIGELNLQMVRDLFLSTMKAGNVSHAYLFVGPRGSGKTSAARILAKVVNCEKNQDNEVFGEPCGECLACKTIDSGSGVDIIEIDAASNGLVEDIRDLREKARLSPIQLKKKIYIIDEVHMVSTAGFNALLKTLEEPPKHVMFILCTTEAHKVPETIVSRCARVSFTRASMVEMIEALQRVIGAEDLKVSAEALSMIADAADGSFREGHKLLEQLSNFGGEITEDLTKKSLGLIGRSFVKKIIEAVVGSDSVKIVECFVEMEQMGVKPSFLLGSLLNNLRQLTEEDVRKGRDISVYLKIMTGLIKSAEDVRVSPDPLLPIEMVLLSMCEGGEKGSRSQTSDVRSQEEKGSSDKITITQSSVVVEERVNVQVRQSSLADFEKIKNEWGSFLDEFAGENVSLAGLLRQSEPLKLDGKAITLSVRSKFQQDMLEREVKKRVIEEAMGKTWGPVTFKTVLGAGCLVQSADTENIDNGGDRVVKVEEIFN